MCCEMCQRKRCNKGRPCKRLEKIFKASGIHKSKWIRPHRSINGVEYYELPFSYLKHALEPIQQSSLFGTDGRKKPVRYNENWEMENED